MCLHPGCDCESFKGAAYWNERENLVDIDHSARLAEGQKRWGSENAEPKGESFKCDKCKDEFWTAEHLKIHKANYHKEK